MGDLHVLLCEPGVARQDPGNKCYTILPLGNFKSTLLLHISLNPFQNGFIMLQTIKIKCFKEKLINIPPLFMKKRSLKSKKFKMADF